MTSKMEIIKMGGVLRTGAGNRGLKHAQRRVLPFATEKYHSANLLKLKIRSYDTETQNYYLNVAISVSMVLFYFTLLSCI